MIQPTMIMINGIWQGRPTFNMMPIDINCPYAECIYDTNGKTLVVISKAPKKTLTPIPKYDDNGDVARLKNGKRPNGKEYKEEMRMIDTTYEHYLMNEVDIVNFIKMTAINADTFDYNVFLNADPAKITNIKSSDSTLEPMPKIEVVGK